jgi:succinate-semialdehyde dehydrogenase/glutarate-semialdehyde dehydrogenase
MGPVKSPDIVAKVRNHVDDALTKGAHVVGGESFMPNGSSSENFLRPAVVLDWTTEMILAKEETFGPVAPIRSCDSVSDMVDLANASDYGLAAYVFGADIRQITKVVNELDYGVVGVNQLNSAFANAPIGGWKESGIGVESGQEGTDQYLRPKFVAIDTA